MQVQVDVFFAFHVVKIIVSIKMNLIKAQRYAVIIYMYTNKEMCSEKFDVLKKHRNTIGCFFPGVAFGAASDCPQQVTDLPCGLAGA